MRNPILLLTALTSVYVLLTAAASPTPYNITITDDSPTIAYLPSRSGPSSSTWNVSYTSSPWSTYVQDSTIGTGTSSHYTTFIRATATVGWVGTAAYVWGLAGSGVTTFTLDGNVLQNVPATTYMIGAVYGLNYGWHELVLTVTGAQGVTITGMTLTTGLGKPG